MSYILEALKKADQEREIGAVPGLATPHETERTGNRSRRWLWIIAVLLGVNFVLVALLLAKRDIEAPGPTQATPERQQAVTEEPRVQPGRQTPDGRTSQAPNPGSTELPQKKQTYSTGELVTSAKPVKSPNSGPLSPPEDAVAPRSETATTATPTTQLPSWYELPHEFRMQLSLPRPDLHVWSEDPRNRFILVNLKKYREGETLESGLVLEEILPEGMVMTYRGERFLVEK
jgi:general secretion pathway protein B